MVPEGEPAQVAATVDDLLSAGKEPREWRPDSLEGTAFLHGGHLDAANCSPGRLLTTVIAQTGALVPVPEPETAALMLGGLAMLGWMSRRREPR